ncbi:hypothetical protein D3C86_1725870 [compost metagenome]
MPGFDHDIGNSFRLKSDIGNFNGISSGLQALLIAAISSTLQDHIRGKNFNRGPWKCFSFVVHDASKQFPGSLLSLPKVKTFSGLYSNRDFIT